MPGEIQYALSLSVTKNGITVNGSLTLAKDMTGSEMIAATQSLTTTAAAVNVGGCDQIQSVLIKNMSGTESVAVGLDSTVTTQRFSTLKPNGGILLEQPPTLFYAKTVANTADIWIVACED